MYVCTNGRPGEYAARAKTSFAYLGQKIDSPAWKLGGGAVTSKSSTVNDLVTHAESQPSAFPACSNIAARAFRTKRLGIVHHRQQQPAFVHSIGTYYTVSGAESRRAA